MTSTWARTLRFLAVLLTALACFAAGALGTSAAASGTHPQQVVTWGASADRMPDAMRLADKTVRNLVHSSVPGTRARVTLSNEFGDRPVTFTSVYVGLSTGDAGVEPGTNRRVLFEGARSVTIPPGERTTSDPVPGHIPADTTLAVSLDLKGDSGVPTGHNLAMQTSYVGDGDAADERGDRFDSPVSSWYWVSEVTVTRSRVSSAVAFFGDSITDGHSSTPSANVRYPDQWFDLSPGRSGVLNAGISANRLLGDSSGGQAGTTRFERDVLNQSGVRTVVILIGINDIRWDLADEPGDLTNAYTALARRAKARGMCVVGATLTPFEGGSRYSADREQVRSGVNSWVRTDGRGVFDQVVDFDAATRDRDQPTRFATAYDAGDHLHPSDAGYAAMAKAAAPAVQGCASR